MLDLLMNALLAYESSSEGEDDPSSSLANQQQHKALPGDTQHKVKPTSITQTRSTPGAYVSKRKRPSQNSSNTAEDDSSSRSSIVSQYLSSTYSSATKHAKLTSSLPHSFEVIKSDKHTKPVLSLQWHVSDPRLLLSSSLDGSIKLWDVTKPPKCIATYQFHQKSAAVRKACWLTSNTIISGGYDKMAVHSDVESFKVLSQLKHNGYVTAIACPPGDTNTVLTGDSERNILQWDLRTGKTIKQCKGAEGKVLDMIFLQNGKEFVTSTDMRRNAFGRALSVWDYSGGVIVSQQLYVEPYTCPCLRVHPRDPVFLAQSNGNYIVFFSSTRPFKLNKYKRYEGHTVQGYDVGFDLSPDGTMVCSASSNGKVIFYNYSSSGVLTSFDLSQSPCLAVEWSPTLSSTVAVSDWKGDLFILR